MLDRCTSGDKRVNIPILNGALPFPILIERSETSSILEGPDSYGSPDGPAYPVTHLRSGTGSKEPACHSRLMSEDSFPGWP